MCERGVERVFPMLTESERSVWKRTQRQQRRRVEARGKPALAKRVGNTPEQWFQSPGPGCCRTIERQYPPQILAGGFNANPEGRGERQKSRDASVDPCQPKDGPPYLPRAW